MSFAMEYHKSISKGEREYIKMWQKESGKWLKLGLFDSAVYHLKLKQTGIHVDIGSGNGAMLSAINEQCPDLTLIGVERYHSLLALLEMNFRKTGIPCRILDKNDVDEFDSYKFTSDVTLIRDNIQLLLLLKELLRGKKVNSASFMFPGISKISAIQRVNREQELELLRLMAGNRKKVFECMSELVVPGGRFVLAEKSCPESLSDEVTGKMMALMGGCEPYWEFEDRDVLIGVNDEITGVRRIDTIQGRVLDESEDLAFIVQLFRRNGYKYGNDISTPTEKQLRNASKWQEIIKKVCSKKAVEI